MMNDRNFGLTAKVPPIRMGFGEGNICLRFLVIG